MRTQNEIQAMKKAREEKAAARKAAQQNLEKKVLELRNEQTEKTQEIIKYFLDHIDEIPAKIGLNSGGTSKAFDKKFKFLLDDRKAAYFKIEHSFNGTTLLLVRFHESVTTGSYDNNTYNIKYVTREFPLFYEHQDEEGKRQNLTKAAEGLKLYNYNAMTTAQERVKELENKISEISGEINKLKQEFIPIELY